MDPAAVFSDYPYLGACFVGLPIWTLVIVAAGDRRGFAILAGLVLVPLLPLAVFHEDVFWSPKRLLGVGFSIEDALYLFLTGSFVCAVAMRQPSYPVLRTDKIPRALGRMAMTGIAAAILWWLISATFADPFTAAILAGLTIVGSLACCRPTAIWPSAVAGLSYCLYHCANVWVALALWPDFLLAWSPQSPWSVPVFTVPFGEIAFAAIFGTGHALVVALAFDPPTPLTQMFRRNAPR